MPSGVYKRTEKHRQITKEGMKRFYQNGDIHPRGMKGKKQTEEAKQKQKESLLKRRLGGEKIGFQKGQVLTEEHLQKLRKIKSEEVKKNMREATKLSFKNGRVSGMKGKKETEEHKQKNREANTGENNKMWKDGRTKRKTLKYRETLVGRKKPKQCEICGALGKICFDHDHVSDKFRGWICIRCNLTLGLVKDNSELLMKLSEYIKNNK